MTNKQNDLVVKCEDIFQFRKAIKENNPKHVFYSMSEGGLKKVSMPIGIGLTPAPTSFIANCYAGGKLYSYQARGDAGAMKAKNLLVKLSGMFNFELVFGSIVISEISADNPPIFTFFESTKKENTAIDNMVSMIDEIADAEVSFIRGGVAFLVLAETSTEKYYTVCTIEEIFEYVKNKISEFNPVDRTKEYERLIMMSELARSSEGLVENVEETMFEDLYKN